LFIDWASFGLELKEVGLRWDTVKINFRLRPNAPWAGPGEILKFQPMQTSTFVIY
jgi:hypothetical protein